MTRGNIITMKRRLETAACSVNVDVLKSVSRSMNKYDIFFIGGSGQDFEQEVLLRSLY